MAATKANGETQFKDDEENNGYVCLQGHFLRGYAQQKKNGYIRYYNFEACAQCPARSQCSTDTYFLIRRNANVKNRIVA